MAINLSRPKTKNDFFRQNHREITIGFSVLLALLVSAIFPVKASGESFWLCFFLYLVFPVVVIHYLLKETLPSFGLSWGKRKDGLILSAIVTIVFVFLNYLVVSRPELRNQLTLPLGIATNYWYFLFFEIIIILPIHFFSELFFRGFIQLGLEKKLGVYALISQAVFQTLPVLRGPWIMILLVLFSAFAAGLVARQSRSIYYSFISMWIISVSLDIMIISVLHHTLS